MLKELLLILVDTNLGFPIAFLAQTDEFSKAIALPGRTCRLSPDA
jgi:hypothetical protein